jgi:hypothetical protein
MQIFVRRSQTMANYIACSTQKFKVQDILTYTAILYLFRPNLFLVSLFSVRPELSLIEWENSHQLHAHGFIFKGTQAMRETSNVGMWY